MPRQKSFVTAVRELVRKEISQQIANLLGSIGGAGTMKAPPAPARATGSGPPTRLEDEAPSRPPPKTA